MIITLNAVCQSSIVLIFVEIRRFIELCSLVIIVEKSLGNMKILIILLALPFLPAIWANIKIEIITSDDDTKGEIHTSGSEVDVISDEEINTFELYTERIKDAVNNYTGMRPDDVFLKSPTPWGDLYKTYGWRQVTRVLKPVRATMLRSKNMPSLISTQYFNNTSSKTAVYKAYMRQSVEDTIASFWETSGELSAGLNISYGVNIPAMAVSGNAAINYISKWGENVMKSQTVIIGSEVGLEITLQPNQRVVAQLYGTRRETRVNIDYEASLYGAVAVNYNNGYKDHHFWNFDVDSVLTAGGFNRTVLSTEEIVLSYFIDSQVDVRDIDTNDLLFY